MTQTDFFALGTKVFLRGQADQIGVIVGGPLAQATGPMYEVFFDARRPGQWVAAEELETPRQVELTWVSAQRFLADLACLKLSNPFSDVLYSLGASRTHFLVYQFQPVFKFLQSQAQAHGMLIADEVGLGKTIEAGLILKELIARGSGRRVLVVCPANLREKWRSEMQQRFGLKFDNLDAQRVRELSREVAQTGTLGEFRAVASLEGLRRREILNTIEEMQIPFDLVIVDEAHHLRNPETASFGLGETLSEHADNILLLSATPVQTGESDLLTLLRLIDPGQFDGSSAQYLDDLLAPNKHINRAVGLLSKPPVDGGAVAAELERVFGTALGRGFRGNPLFTGCIERARAGGSLSSQAIIQLRRDLERLHTLAPYYTRTRKREVAQDSPVRRSTTLTIDLLDAERRFYDAWLAYAAAVAKSKNPGLPTAWALSMRERQAASCLPAAAAAVESLWQEQTPADIESSDPDAPDSDNDAWPSFGPTAQTQSLRARRQAAIDAASALPDEDTKSGRLLETVQRLLAEAPARKILVFTFFKGTLHYLERRLGAAAIDFRAISGDVGPSARAEILDAFQRDRNATVLLSTEVGAEGLDFQFCDSVINYDLPWNPMRVEQRIGRIDRYGQRAKSIQVISFFVDATIDTRILERLYERIGVFERSIGELEPILGPEVRQLQEWLFSSRLSEDEEREQVERTVVRMLEHQRRSEEFEQARSELLGQGDFINQEITASLGSGRFVSPIETRALLCEWIEGHKSQARESLRTTARDGIVDLHLSDGTIGRIRSGMRRKEIYDQTAHQLLTRIEQKHHAWCTFDSDVAQRHDALPFIDVGHPFVRVSLEDERERLLLRPFERAGSATVQRRPGWPERFALFVYALDLTGAEPQRRMLPVAVDLEAARVVDIGDEALGVICAGEHLNQSAPGNRIGPDITRQEPIALAHASGLRNDIQSLSLETQRSRLAVRRTALARSFDARIRRNQETLERIGELRIRPVWEARVRSLQAEKQAELSALDNLPEPVATIELQAAVLVTCAGSDEVPQQTGGDGARMHEDGAVGLDSPAASMSATSSITDTAEPVGAGAPMGAVATTGSHNDVAHEAGIAGTDGPAKSIAFEPAPGPAIQAPAPLEAEHVDNVAMSSDSRVASLDSQPLSTESAAGAVPKHTATTPSAWWEMPAEVSEAIFGSEQVFFGRRLWLMRGLLPADTSPESLREAQETLDQLLNRALTALMEAAGSTGPGERPRASFTATINGRSPLLIVDAPEQGRVEIDLAPPAANSG